MATIREENCYLSRTSHYLAVATASGVQKNKLSLQRHSSVPMLSFDTEEEELNIATRADTMMTALSHQVRVPYQTAEFALSISSGQTDNDITPFINCLYC